MTQFDRCGTCGYITDEPTCPNCQIEFTQPTLEERVISQLDLQSGDQMRTAYGYQHDADIDWLLREKLDEMSNSEFLTLLSNVMESDNAE